MSMTLKEYSDEAVKMYRELGVPFEVAVTHVSLHILCKERVILYQLLMDKKILSSEMVETIQVLAAQDALEAAMKQTLELHQQQSTPKNGLIIPPSKPS